MSNAQEFIEALNFQEFLSLEEMKDILDKSNTESMQFQEMVKKVADILIL